MFDSGEIMFENVAIVSAVAVDVEQQIFLHHFKMIIQVCDVGMLIFWSFKTGKSGVCPENKVRMSLWVRALFLCCAFEQYFFALSPSLEVTSWDVIFL